MQLHTPPIATTEMMIRRPIAEVFEAFVDPAIATKFWFSRSSGRLEEGKRLRWGWEMLGGATGGEEGDLPREQRRDRHRRAD